MAVTTLTAFIAEMITAVQGITPTTPLHSRTPAFKLADDEQRFREWAPANPDACTRVFTIYDLFDDDPVESSDAVADLQQARVEVLCAYQHDKKYGANNTRAMQRVIREDYRELETTLGIHGSANYTNGCTLKDDDAPFSVEEFTAFGVSILRVPFTVRLFHSI